MKKKFLILTLCFTLVFSGLNYKKSYADGGVISLPILATVSALAVGTGIALKNVDDIYNLGRVFYDYVEKNNNITWGALVTSFNACVSITGNKLVSVKSEFLEIVKGFFDDVFGASDDLGVVDPTYFNGIPVYDCYIGNMPYKKQPIGLGQSVPMVNGTEINLSDFKAVFTNISSTSAYVDYYFQGEKYNSNAFSNRLVNYIGVAIFKANIADHYLVYPQIGFKFSGNDTQFYDAGASKQIYKDVLKSAVTLPYQGGYSWDNVNDRVDEGTGELPLPIPGNLDNLLGQSKDDFWSNTDDLTSDGSFDISDTSNPSISIDKTDTIVGSGSVDKPVDTPIEKPVLPSLPSWGSGLDFSPITQGVFTDKFPFCLAKDVKDIISIPHQEKEL